MALISKETIDRIVMNLRGKMKHLVNDRDPNIVFPSMKLLHKILELDPKHRILDFELVQNMVLNLDHSNERIFNETIDLLSHNRVLDDNNYLKVIFSSTSLSKLVELYPKMRDPAKVAFCLAVVFEFTHDPKTAGVLMAKASKEFYAALHTSLLAGDRRTKLIILKILYQLLKYSSKTGPLELFPDWNVLTKFMNINYGEIKKKDFQIFSQAICTILLLSNRENFAERFELLELFKNFSEALKTKAYENRDIEMKNIILEVSYFHARF